jgi:hypothetical protein
MLEEGIGKREGGKRVRKEGERGRKERRRAGGRTETGRM